MINPRYCSLCPHSEVEPPIYDFDGNKLSLWTVNCRLDKTKILYDLQTIDEPPTGCPYLLEHTLTMSKLSEEDIAQAKHKDPLP